MDLDFKVRAAHEDYWRDQQQAAERHAVVLVEGDDDRDVVEAILERRSPTWSTRAHVAVAGGRKHVLQRMKTTFPGGWGLVDRDTWTDAEVAQRTAAERFLVVTSGWCLENLFFDPAWLERFDGGIAAHVAAARERWVRAGALWWTLQRAREGQQAWQEALRWTYGQPREDIDVSSAEALTDSLTHLVPEHVRDSARFEARAVSFTFEQRCQEILALPEEAQWRLGVHGKAAFAELLVPALNAARHQQSAADWRRDLASEIGRPPPFDSLVAMLLP